MFLRPRSCARGGLDRYYIVSPFNSFLMSNFNLSPKLRQFIELEQSARHPLLGLKLPISIKRGYPISKRIAIYPEDGFWFFMGLEVCRIYDIASLLDLQISVQVSGEVPVIVVSDY